MMVHFGVPHAGQYNDPPLPNGREQFGKNVESTIALTQIQIKEYDIRFFTSRNSQGIGTIPRLPNHLHPRPTLDEHPETCPNYDVIINEQDPDWV
jgi:hypothetical protein